MDKQFDVIGIENPILDFAVKTNQIPGTDSVSTLQDYSWQPGGNVSNAVIALTRLGARTAVVGSVGEDEMGHFCKTDFERHGVDCSHLYVQPGETSFDIAIAEESSNGRSFIARFGAYPDLTEEQIDESFICGTKCIHICVPVTANIKKAVEFARKNHVLVSVDAGDYDDVTGKYVIENSDIIIMSEFFYRSLYDDDSYLENMQKLVSAGCKVAVVTLGANGCAGADIAGNTFRLPSFSGHKIVDTTGAGDVFHGGFLYGYLQGWDIKKCATFASAVSYINCMTLGGRAGIPGKEMVDEFLALGTINLEKVAPRTQYYKDLIRFC